ncbi:MAG: hypothetical protein R3F20_01830 [Planctomycetota bacterium]
MSDDGFDTIQRLVAADGRYRREAYEFTLEALTWTLSRHRREGRVGHINGEELCDGIRELANRSFGFLTKTVFARWGVTRTEDFGEIVFAMADAELLAKQETDSKADFANGYDFDEVFEQALIYE